MRPLALRLRNYRTWDALDLDLPDGCAAIVGPNGAGKSSVVNAIDYALFGGREVARQRTRDAHEDAEMMIELTFEHAGRLYRARRGVGAKTTLDLEESESYNEWNYGGADDWQPLTRETQAATQQLIEDTIGLTRQTFRASAFLAQGDGAAFTEAAPRDRKEILAEVLGLAIWDRLHEHAAGECHGREQEATLLFNQIEIRETELQSRRATIEERDSADAARHNAEKELVDVEAALVVAGRELAEAEAAGERLAAAERLVGQRRNQMGELSGRLDTIRDRCEQLSNELGRRPAYERLAVDIGSLERRHSETVAAFDTTRRAREQVAALRDHIESVERDRVRAADEQTNAAARLEHLLQEDTKNDCPTCGQTLATPAARQQTLGHIQRDEADAQARCRRYEDELATLRPRLSDHERAASAIVEPIGNVEHDLRQARHAAEQLPRMDALADELARLNDDDRAVVGEMADCARALDHAERDQLAIFRMNPPGKADAIRTRTVALQAKVDDHRRKLVEIERQIARCDERLDRMARIERELTEARETHAKIGHDVDVLRRLVRAYGRDGIPALIVENVAIPAIESEANRILDLLGTQYSVSLRTLRATKGGGVREALDVVVFDGSAEAAYEDFSGGERTRINLALRLALSKLLAHRRGAEVGLLVLDEPEFVDDDGMTRLVATLRELERDFGRVYLISHQPILREGFDRVLAVEKGPDGRSRLVGAREAVAA